MSVAPFKSVSTSIQRIWGTEVSRVLEPGATFLGKLWAQFPQAEQRLALLLPGSATPDEPLSISAPWFTFPEKGNHSSDIVGFKSTVLLLVFFCLICFFCIPSPFSLPSFGMNIIYCFCFVFCVGLVVITLFCFIGCFRVYSIGC